MDYIHNNRNWFLIAYVDYYNMKNGVCYFIDAFKYYLILIIGTYLYLYIHHFAILLGLQCREIILI